MGVPRARSGAFASVYKMTPRVEVRRAQALQLPQRGPRRRVIRPFPITSRNSGRRSRRALVGFEYHPEGIRVGKWWYPTLTMEWVRGKSLGEWVREAMERRNPDVAAVRAIADSWVRLVEEIQAAEIAHGDLQHDNVMVVGNQLVLVDYDGMCVPALAPTDPRKRLEQLEFGKPAYQHPTRANEKLGLHLDHFSAWVILIALRADRRRSRALLALRHADRQREPALQPARHGDARQVAALAGTVAEQGRRGARVVAHAAHDARQAVQAVRPDPAVHARPVRAAAHARRRGTARLGRHRGGNRPARETRQGDSRGRARLPRTRSAGSASCATRRRKTSSPSRSRPTR